MIISLDYDETFTADVIFWTKFVELAKTHGHKVVCVSSRSNIPGNHYELRATLPDIPYVLCSHKSKEKIARAHGYNIDVWIDDTPESVME